MSIADPDPGNTFDERKFNLGKLYPCIGMGLDSRDVGLHLKINLGVSDDHPFLYQGPFP